MFIHTRLWSNKFMRDWDKIRLRLAAGGTVLAVKVVPGSSRDKIAGVLGDSLKVATSAPPERGKANAAIAAILAKALGVDKRRVTLASGPASPRKEFLVEGVDVDELHRRLKEMT